LIVQIAQPLQRIIEIEKAWLPPHAFAPNPSNPMESEMLRRWQCQRSRSKFEKIARFALN
jgi:hypothetical protein